LSENLNTIKSEILAVVGKKIALNENADKLEIRACLHQNE
jgi:hypothetical protein